MTQVMCTVESISQQSIAKIPVSQPSLGFILHDLLNNEKTEVMVCQVDWAFLRFLTLSDRETKVFRHTKGV